MKIPSATLSALLLLSLLGARADRAPVTVRVLTYNIHHGEGRDGQLDLTRLANVMKAARPDIIALQEVDRATMRSGGVDQLAELARLLGMHAEFGKALDYAGGAYGVAVLSRWPLLDPSNQPLPPSPDDEPRTALTVRLKAGPDGPWIRFTSTHLASGRVAPGRLAQARYLNEILIAGEPHPSVLAGDLNARLDTDVMETFEPHWGNAARVLPSVEPTSGRRGPSRDYVLYRPAERWRVVETEVMDEPVASDHRPVLIVLEWRGAGGRDGDGL